MSIEKQLFESVLKTMIDSRDRIWSKKTKEKTEIENLEDNNGKIKQEQENEELKQVSSEKNNNPVIKIKETLPEFIGTDEKKYSLRTDDIISVPENMAEMLLKRGVAKKVKI